MATLSESLTLLEELMAKAKAKEEARRDAFIRSRTQWEATIEAFATGVRKADKEITEVLDLPEEITCQALLPSLYKDTFVKADFEAEKAVFDEMRLKVGRVLKALVDESITLTEAYVNG
jgi:hypothetical protein